MPIEVSLGTLGGRKLNTQTEIHPVTFVLLISETIKPKPLIKEILGNYINAKNDYRVASLFLRCF